MGIPSLRAYHPRRYLPAFLNSYMGHPTGPELQAPHPPKSEPLEQASTSERGQPLSATIAKQVVDTSKAAIPVQGKIAENAANILLNNEDILRAAVEYVAETKIAERTPREPSRSASTLTLGDLQPEERGRKHETEDGSESTF